MRTTGILRPTWDRFVDDSVSYSGVVSKWERSEVYDGPWHAHVGFEALLCVLGEGVFLFGEQRIPYTSGSLLLFDGRVPHQVSMQSDYQRWNICVWPERLFADGMRRSAPEEGVLLLPGSSQVYHMHISDRDLTRLIHLFESIHQEFSDRREGYKQLIQLHLAELMVWLHRHNTELAVSRSRSASPMTPWPMAEILNYIERNLDSGISVQSIADHFHYSTSHLHRMMVQTLGQTPSQFIQARRIAKAQTLLLQTNLTISEIASRVGMSNGANLARLFRNELGMTPSEYREQVERSSSSQLPLTRGEMIWRRVYAS